MKDLHPALLAASTTRRVSIIASEDIVEFMKKTSSSLTDSLKQGSISPSENLSIFKAPVRGRMPSYVAKSFISLADREGLYDPE